jgi:stage V sporulation protein G
MVLQITDVKITLTSNKDPVKAFVSFLVNGCLLIRDIKVISIADGYFVAMPSKKLPTGNYLDTVAPINWETRKIIEDVVLREFERATGERVTRRNPESRRG